MRSPADDSIGARRLVTEVYRLVDRKVISSRSPAADAALDLHHSIDPDWVVPLQGDALAQAVESYQEAMRS